MKTALSRHARMRAVGLLLVLAGLWLQTTDRPGIAGLRDRLEHLAYDLRLRIALPKATSPHPDILIVAVDEESLRRVGRWPWPRARLAQLVDRLAQAGAAVVAFDFLFSEPEAAPLLPAGLREDPRLPADLRARLQALEAGDARLARAFTQMDTVLGFLLHPQPPAGEASPPPFDPPPFDTGGLPVQSLPVPALPGATFNLPILSRAAGGHGFVSVLPDEDGVIRRVPLLLRHGGHLYPSLALETARVFLLADRIRLETASTPTGPVLTGLRLAESRLPTDAQGVALVPYRPPGAFVHLPAWKVLEGTFEPDAVEGRILLVGATALALSDLRPSPVRSAMPGVEIHASLLAGLLAGRLPVAPDWVGGANAALILGLGLLGVWLGPRLSAPLLLPAALLLVGGWTAGNYWLWRTQGLALAMATPLLVVTTLTGWFAAAGYARAVGARRRLQEAFGQYVPPQIVARMAEAPERWRDTGETREMTVLFADIRGFTRIAESLSAQALSVLLNRFFTPMTRILFEHQGTIDKYVGDMIMAFWNAPLDDPRHASHAVAAALAMCREMDRINRCFRSEGLPELRIGIGIHTGPMHVGDMGSRYRRAYTVLGDSVNLGSRLEGLTRLYEVDIVVSEATAQAAPEFAFRPLDRIRVKGKAQAVEVHEAIGPAATLSPRQRQELEVWHGFLEAFRATRWKEARARLEELGEALPVGLRTLYLERLETLSRNPPPAGWDGSFVREVK